MTDTEAVPLRAPLSVAVAVSVTGPSGRATPDAVKVPPEPRAAVTPLTETPTRLASVATPVTVAVAVFRYAPLAGESIETTGGTVSTVTLTEADPVFPARSLAAKESVTEPSGNAKESTRKCPPETVAATPLTVTVTASSQSPVTGCGEAVTSEPSAGEMFVMRGATVSTAKWTVWWALLPAASCA